MKIKNFSYSLLIPTRNRWQTAIFAVRSGLNTCYGDLQIVVSDNSDDSTLETELKKAGLLDKVTYHKTETVLSMRDNWERALDLATGDIISVIGDDDAVMPDAYMRANFFFSNHVEAEVLSSMTAIYKWSNYGFPGRHHYLYFSLDPRVALVSEPRKLLRAAYNYTYQAGTGPGLYYGFVKRDFLEKIKKKRGRWLVDSIPDFDSGYVTLMYTTCFGISHRQLFVQGHSGTSNSGVMRYQALNVSNMERFSSESKENIAEYFLQNIKATRAVIVGCQFRFLDEARKALKDKELELDLVGAFNYMADGVRDAYEGVSFLTSVAELKSLARNWKIEEKVKIPENTGVSRGVWFEAGLGTPHVPSDAQYNIIYHLNNENQQSYPNLIINGQLAGFHSIIDAVRYVYAALPHLTPDTDPAYVEYFRENLQPQLQAWTDRATQAIIEEKYKVALSNLMSVVEIDALNSRANYLLGLTYSKMGQWHRASAALATALTVNADLDTINLYVQSLFQMNQSDSAIAFVEHVAKISQNSDIDRLLFDLYASCGHHLKLIDLAENLKQTMDGNANFWRILAQSHKAVENHAAAVEAAEKAIAIDPESLAQEILAEWLAQQEVPRVLH